MAIITPSAQISEIRGSVGTTTYSRNRFRAYAKIRTAPTDTPSNYKTAARDALTAGNAAWKALSDADRSAFIKAAKSFNTRERLGQIKPLTGYTYFMRWSIHNYLMLLDLPTAPGQPVKLRRNSRILPFNDADIFTIDLNMSTGNANAYSLIYTSPPISSSIMSVNSTQLLFIQADQTFNGSYARDITENWINRFGGLDAYPGYKVFIGVKLFDPTTGSIGAMQIVSYILQ